MIHPRYQGAILIYYKYLLGCFKGGKRLLSALINGWVIAFIIGVDFVIEKLRNLVFKHKKRSSNDLNQEDGAITEAFNY